MQLVTWHTQWCCGLDGVCDPARIVAAVQAMGDCDVLCLQEIAVNYPALTGGTHDQVAQLQALLPGWTLVFGAAVDEFGANGQPQRFGNLIATRLPVHYVHHVPLPYPSEDSTTTMPRMCTSAVLEEPHLGPVRVMTTHLEYGSKRQRMAQARFLRRWHFEALSSAFHPPQAEEPGTPYQARPYPEHAVLCGNFNFTAHDAEYEALHTRASVMECLDAGWPEGVVGVRWHDAWVRLHGQHSEVPQPPTFSVHEQRWTRQPVTCDFVWVSDSLRDKVRSFHVDGDTTASNHQPVRAVIGK